MKQALKAWHLARLSRCVKPNSHSISLCTKTTLAQRLPEDLEQQTVKFHRFVITSRQRHGYSLSRIFNMDEIPMRFKLPFSRTLEFSGIITNDCILCFFTLARLISKYVSIQQNFHAPEKIFLQKLSATSRDPLWSPNFNSLQFNLCKNRSAYSRINTVCFFCTSFRLSNLGVTILITHGDIQINRVKQTKHLGVYPEENLKWAQHIDKVGSKVSRSISSLRQA